MTKQIGSMHRRYVVTRQVHAVVIASFIPRIDVLAHYNMKTEK